MRIAAFFRLLSALLGDALRWLFAEPRRALCWALILLAAWLWHGRDQARDLAEQRKAQAAQWQARFRDQKAEMVKFIGLVRAARVEAARLDQLNIARVNGRWGAILQETRHDYQADLGSALAAVDLRMRRAGPDAVGVDRAGGGGAAQLPAIPTLSTGPLRLDASAIVDRADIDACTIRSVRLDHLIDAWDLLAAIDVNDPVSAPSEAFEK